MKKYPFLLLASCLLLSGCGGGGQTSTGAPSMPPSESTSEGPTETSEISRSEAPKHATSMALDPNKDQQYQAGDVVTIKATLSPTPSFDEERTFTWSSSNTSVGMIDVSEDTRSVTLSCLSVGTTTITATNDFNSTDPNFTKSINVTVLEAGRDTYIWQYEKENLEEFGYKKDEAPTGALSGYAKLSGMTWKFERQFNNSIASSSSALKLGKADMTDGAVTFKNGNTKKVKEIRVEAASSDGSSFMTAKVGNETFISTRTNKDMKRYSSNYSGNASGNIVISFTASSGYLLIKSIVVVYDNSSEVSKTTYFDFASDEDVSKWGTSYSTRVVNNTADNVKVTFSNAGYNKITDTDTYGAVTKRGTCVVESTDATKVISSIKVNVVQWLNKTKTVNVITSNDGTKGYGPEDTVKTISFSKDTNNKEVEFDAFSYENGMYTYLLDMTSNDNQFLITSIEVKTIDGSRASYNSEVAPVIVKGPTKTEYKSGAAFNPNGMKVMIYPTDQDYFSATNVVNSVTWDAINEVEGSVTGHFEGHNITYTGLTITENA